MTIYEDNILPFRPRVPPEEEIVPVYKSGLSFSDEDFDDIDKFKYDGDALELGVETYYQISSLKKKIARLEESHDSLRNTFMWFGIALLVMFSFMNLK